MTGFAQKPSADVVFASCQPSGPFSAKASLLLVIGAAIMVGATTAGCDSSPEAPATTSQAETSPGAVARTESPTASKSPELARPADDNAVPAGQNPTAATEKTDPSAEGETRLFPGLAAPKCIPAADAALSDDVEVIGVVVDGQPRAYVCDALRSDSSRIIIDLIERTPVFVTYCAESGMARVFSQSSPETPVSVAHTGVRADELQLVVNGATFPQSSLEIPLADVDFVKTLWIAWKDEHPDTMVFPGESAAPNSAQP